MLIGISGRIGSGKDTVGKIIQYLLYMSEEVKGRYYPYDVFIAELETVNFHGSVNYEIKKFADKLKDFVCMLIGCTREQLEDQDFKNKELPEEWNTFYISNPKLGKLYYPFSSKKEANDFALEEVTPRGIFWRIEEQKTTPRLLLQIIGTECIRDKVHPNAWVNALFSNYKPLNTISKINTITGKFIGTDIDAYPKWIITDMRFPNELEAVKSRGGITIRVNRPYSTVAGDNGIPATFNHAQFHPSETSLDSATFDFVISNDKDIEHLINEVRKILEKLNII